jgi:hypothetical protein
VFVVPSATSAGGRLRFDQLVPSEESFQRIADRLKDSAVIGTRVVIEPPSYRGITVVAKLRGRKQTSPTRLQADGLRALYEYFHPIIGGPDGTGWPFGRAVDVAEIYPVLQALSDTKVVEDVRLFPADPTTGHRGEQTQRLALESNWLLFSYEHQVLVEDE